MPQNPQNPLLTLDEWEKLYGMHSAESDQPAEEPTHVRTPRPGLLPHVGALATRLLSGFGSSVVGAVPSPLTTAGAAAIGGGGELLAQEFESADPFDYKTAALESALSAVPMSRVVKGISAGGNIAKQVLANVARNAGLVEAGNMARRKVGGESLLPSTREQLITDLGTSAVGAGFGVLAGHVMHPKVEAELARLEAEAGAKTANDPTTKLANIIAARVNTPAADAAAPAPRLVRPGDDSGVYAGGSETSAPVPKRSRITIAPSDKPAGYALTPDQVAERNNGLGAFSAEDTGEAIPAGVAEQQAAIARRPNKVNAEQIDSTGKVRRGPAVKQVLDEEIKKASDIAGAQRDVARVESAQMKRIKAAEDRANLERTRNEMGGTDLASIKAGEERAAQTALKERVEAEKAHTQAADMVAKEEKLARAQSAIDAAMEGTKVSEPHIVDVTERVPTSTGSRTMRQSHSKPPPEAGAEGGEPPVPPVAPVAPPPLKVVKGKRGVAPVVPIKPTIPPAAEVPKPETSVHGHVFEDPEGDAKFLGISKEELLKGGKPYKPEAPTTVTDAGLKRLEEDAARHQAAVDERAKDPEAYDRQHIKNVMADEEAQDAIARAGERAKEPLPPQTPPEEPPAAPVLANPKPTPKAPSGGAALKPEAPKTPQKVKTPLELNRAEVNAVTREDVKNWSPDDLYAMRKKYPRDRRLQTIIQGELDAKAATATPSTGNSATDARLRKQAARAQKKAQKASEASAAPVKGEVAGPAPEAPTAAPSAPQTPSTQLDGPLGARYITAGLTDDGKVTLAAHLSEGDAMAHYNGMRNSGGKYKRIGNAKVSANSKITDIVSNIAKQFGVKPEDVNFVNRAEAQAAHTPKPGTAEAQGFKVEGAINTKPTPETPVAPIEEAKAKIEQKTAEGTAANNAKIEQIKNAKSVDEVKAAIKPDTRSPSAIMNSKESKANFAERVKTMSEDQLRDWVKRSNSGSHYNLIASRELHTRKLAADKAAGKFEQSAESKSATPAEPVSKITNEAKPEVPNQDISAMHPKGSTVHAYGSEGTVLTHGPSGVRVKFTKGRMAQEQGPKGYFDVDPKHINTTVVPEAPKVAPKYTDADIAAEVKGWNETELRRVIAKEKVSDPIRKAAINELNERLKAGAATPANPNNGFEGPDREPSTPAEPVKAAEGAKPVLDEAAAKAAYDKTVAETKARMKPTTTPATVEIPGAGNSKTIKAKIIETLQDYKKKVEAAEETAGIDEKGKKIYGTEPPLPLELKVGDTTYRIAPEQVDKAIERFGSGEADGAFKGLIVGDKVKRPKGNEVPSGGTFGAQKPIIVSAEDAKALGLEDLPYGANIKSHGELVGPTAAKEPFVAKDAVTVRKIDPKDIPADTNFHIYRNGTGKDEVSLLIGDESALKKVIAAIRENGGTKYEVHTIPADSKLTVKTAVDKMLKDGKKLTVGLAEEKASFDPLTPEPPTVPTGGGAKPTAKKGLRVGKSGGLDDARVVDAPPLPTKEDVKAAIKTQASQRPTPGPTEEVAADTPKSSVHGDMIEHQSLAAKWLDYNDRPVTEKNLQSVMQRMDADTLRELLEKRGIKTGGEPAESGMASDTSKKTKGAAPIAKKNVPTTKDGSTKADLLARHGLPADMKSDEIAIKRQDAADDYFELKKQYAEDNDPNTFLKLRAAGQKFGELNSATLLAATEEGVKAPELPPAPKALTPTKPAGKGPTNEELSKLPPAEQQKKLQKIVDDFKKNVKKGSKDQKGAAINDLLLHLGMGAAGALTGSLLNHKDPVTGALLGGATGLFGPVIFRVLQKHIGELPEHIAGQSRKELGQWAWDTMLTAKEMMPDYFRFSLLAKPDNLFMNAVVGPYGSGFWYALERAMSGDERGVKALQKFANVLKFGKGMIDARAEARERVYHSNERGDMKGGAGPQIVQDVFAKPAELMTAGDVTARTFLMDSGFSEPEARAATMTSEPVSGFGKGESNMRKTKGPHGNQSILTRIFLPFFRTQVNQWEQGALRLPVIGSMLRAYWKQAPQSLRTTAAQNTLSVASFGLGYELGKHSSRENQSRWMKFVNNFFGVYGTTASAGFLAGVASHKYNDLTSQLTTATVQLLKNGTPLPTADPIIEAVSAIKSVAVDHKLKLPYGMIPPFLSSKEQLSIPTLLRGERPERMLSGKARVTEDEWSLAAPFMNHVKLKKPMKPAGLQKVDQLNEKLKMLRRKQRIGE